MLAQFWIVLGQVFTLVLLMGVGFILEKLGKLSKIGTGEMTTLLMYVVAPCVIVDSFQVSCDTKMLWTLGIGTVAVSVCYGGYILLSLLFFRRTRADLRAPLRFGAIYGNVGFMGLPLVRAVLGEGASIFAVVNMGLFNIFSWTHGVVLMGGQTAFSLRKAIINPGVLGVFAGLPFLILGIHLPSPVQNAVSFLASLNTPLAMVIIGAQMARADLGAVVKQKNLYAVAGIKLILIPAVTFLLLVPWKLDATFSAATVILSAAPAAGVTAMFAERFQREPETAAQLVTLTTLLSVATLPLVGTLAQMAFG